MSNFHTNTTVNKQMKDGNVVRIDCPDIVASCRKIMGGVDVADQMNGVYDFDRKSVKWWKKVFYKLLMTTAVNSCVIYSEQNEKIDSFKNFLINLAEHLIAKGRESTAIKRTKQFGRLSKRAKYLENVGNHLPIEGTTRRRCAGCSKRNIEKRTKTVCRECNIPFCTTCFSICHT